MRLYPPRHREARFCDRIPDLPAVIHIQTAIDTNVQFIENIFANDTWVSISSEASNAKSGKKTIHKHPQREDRNITTLRRDRGNQQAWNKPPNIVSNKRQTNEKTGIVEHPKLSAATMPSAQYDSGEEERSTYASSEIECN